MTALREPLSLAPTEADVHRAVVELLNNAGRRDVFHFHIPNGELRHVTVARKLHAFGVRPGLPDLCLLWPDGGVAWLEFKSAKGSLSEAQRAFRDFALSRGDRWAMARSLDEAHAILKQWGALR